MAQFVQDLPGLRVPEVVPGGGLLSAKGQQRGPGQLGYERDGLIAGDETVPAEQSHEPWQAGGRQGRVRYGLRIEPQCGQVYQTAPVHLAQFVPVCVHFGRRGDPVGQACRHVRIVHLLRHGRVARGAHRHHDGGGPGFAWFQRDPEGQRLLGEERVTRVDIGLSAEVFAEVAQRHAVVLPLPIEVAHLCEIILDFEQVGKVGVEQNGYLHVDILKPVIAQFQPFPHTIRHLTPADQADDGIPINGAGGFDEVKDRLIVLKGLRGQDGELATIEAQLPSRQVPHIAIEQAVGISHRIGNVAFSVTNREGGTFENADLSVGHDAPIHRGAPRSTRDIYRVPGGDEAGRRRNSAQSIGVIARFSKPILGNHGSDGPDRRSAGCRGETWSP